LANLKSQIKRNRQTNRRRLRNRDYRGSARSAVNQARVSIDTNAPDSKEALIHAIRVLDKAAERGAIHRNNASRRKSRLMRHLAAANAQPVQAVMEPQSNKVEVSEGEIGTEIGAKKKGAAKKASPAKKQAVKKPAAKKTTKK
jgi:small subunit ribosomal protein S20